MTRWRSVWPEYTRRSSLGATTGEEFPRASRRSCARFGQLSSGRPRMAMVSPSLGAQARCPARLYKVKLNGLGARCYVFTGAASGYVEARLAHAGRE